MKIKAVILVLLSALTFAASAAVDWDLNLPAMRTFLAGIKASGQLPARNLNASSITPGDEAIDPSYKKIFEDLQQRIFGTRNLVHLADCQYNCMIMTDYQSKTILVEPAFIKDIASQFSQEDATVVLQFITAHELSHLVQEASVGSKTPGKSINGFVSLYDQMSMINQHTPFEGIITADLPAHAEVDAYALLILRQFLTEKPVVILRAFESTLAANRERFEKTHDPLIKYSDDDVKYRIARIEILLNKLWGPNP